MGAVASFLGLVRNHHEGKKVDYIHYHAYPPMAEKTMKAIAEECSKHYPVSGLALVHRMGRLQVGEASVAVVAASVHRDEAFQACRFMIDEVKRLVPVWKKEGNDEGEEWLEGTSVVE